MELLDSSKQTNKQILANKQTNNFPCDANKFRVPCANLVTCRPTWLQYEPLNKIGIKIAANKLTLVVNLKDIKQS